MLVESCSVIVVAITSRREATSRLIPGTSRLIQVPAEGVLGETLCGCATGTEARLCRLVRGGSRGLTVHDLRRDDVKLDGGFVGEVRGTEV